MRTGGEAFAQYAVAGQHECLKLPEGVSYAEGALIEPLAVGLHGAVLAGLAPRARVLVIGAGPIALAATFWARRLGAGPIAVAARSTRRRELALRMGATSFLTAGADLAAQASATLGGPPDVVFEAVGGPGMIAGGGQLCPPARHDNRAGRVLGSRSMDAGDRTLQGSANPVLDDVRDAGL